MILKSVVSAGRNPKTTCEDCIEYLNIAAAAERLGISRVMVRRYAGVEPSAWFGTRLLFRGSDIDAFQVHTVDEGSTDGPHLVHVVHDRGCNVVIGDPYTCTCWLADIEYVMCCLENGL